MNAMYPETPDVSRGRLSTKPHNMETHHTTLIPTVTRCQKIGTLESFTYALTYSSRDTSAKHTIQRHHRDLYRYTYTHSHPPGKNKPKFKIHSQTQSTLAKSYTSIPSTLLKAKDGVLLFFLPSRTSDMFVTIRQRRCHMIPKAAIKDSELR